MTGHAYILKITPSFVDRVPEALECDEIIIGWSCPGLLDTPDWDKFREIVREGCYPHESTLRIVGAGAGHIWRFIQEMRCGDLVVVPHGPEFYVAKVKGPAFYCETKVEEDTAHRRPVAWLNDKKPIPRSQAKSALISRIKTRGTCTNATDLIDQINECLNAAASGRSPTFETDLKERLIRETLHELRTGRMDGFRFERLIQTILTGMGAVETRKVPPNQDKGIDVYATFLVAGVFRQVVGIQAKHWQPDPPVDKAVIEQLIRGIEEGTERVNLGMVITSGIIGQDASQAAEAYTEEKGIPIELMDGEQFAKLIVEHGISST